MKVFSRVVKKSLKSFGEVHKTFLDMMFLCFFVFDSDGLFTSVFIDFIDCNMPFVADRGGA